MLEMKEVNYVTSILLISELGPESPRPEPILFYRLMYNYMRVVKGNKIALWLLELSQCWCYLGERCFKEQQALYFA